MENEIKIIADNGGGITLQLTRGNDRFQHHYDNPAHCADDVRNAVNGSDSRDWEGNESDNWLTPTHDDVACGGYKIVTVDDLASINNESCSWRNLCELASAFAR